MVVSSCLARRLCSVYVHVVFKLYYRVARENLYTFLLIAAHFCYIKTTEMFNTALELEFCGLFRNIFKKGEKCSYEAVFAFFWQVSEMALRWDSITDFMV